MAEGVEVLESEKKIARIGAMVQVESIPCIRDYNGSTEEALEHYEMTAYIENQIAVKAADMAYLRMLNNILNENTAKGLYKES